MKKWILLTILQLSSNGADTYFTNHAMNNPRFHEHDLLAKPFVRNTPLLAVSSGAALLGTLWIEHKVNRNHPRLADLIAVADVSGHTFGAAFTARKGK